MSASLAQIGEFSFILAALGSRCTCYRPRGQSLIVAGALISIALNPLTFSCTAPFERWILARSALARRLAQRDDPLAELPAHTDRATSRARWCWWARGRVGRRIALALREAGTACVVVDANRERVEELRAQGLPAVSGDAAEPAVLIQAHIAQAALLLIAVPDALGVRRMIETARTLNPQVQVAVRSHNADEANRLAAEAARVFLGEEELAQSMLRHALATMQAIPTMTRPGRLTRNAVREEGHEDQKRRDPHRRALRGAAGHPAHRPSLHPRLAAAPGGTKLYSDGARGAAAAGGGARNCCAVSPSCRRPRACRATSGHKRSDLPVGITGPVVLPARLQHDGLEPVGLAAALRRDAAAPQRVHRHAEHPRRSVISPHPGWAVALRAQAEATSAPPPRPRRRGAGAARC